MRNRLFDFFMANRKRGEFRAEGESNTIYLYDVIVGSKAEAEWWGGVDAETFTKTLLSMTGPVSLRINSPGGDVFAARAMAQAIRDYPDEVTAYVDGYAASAASFITSVADRTVMADGSFLMIHECWTFTVGNKRDHAAGAELLGKIDVSIVETYRAAAEGRGKEPADFEALVNAETWLTADEAIELGLADEKSTGGAKASAWDLSAYGRAPATPPPPAEVVADPVPVVTPENTMNEDNARRSRLAALRLRQTA